MTVLDHFLHSFHHVLHAQQLCHEVDFVRMKASIWDYTKEERRRGKYLNGRVGEMRWIYTLNISPVSIQQTSGRYATPHYWLLAWLPNTNPDCWVTGCKHLNWLLATTWWKGTPQGAWLNLSLRKRPKLKYLSYLSWRMHCAPAITIYRGTSRIRQMSSLTEVPGHRQRSTNNRGFVGVYEYVAPAESKMPMMSRHLQNPQWS